MVWGARLLMSIFHMTLSQALRKLSPLLDVRPEA